MNRKLITRIICIILAVLMALSLIISVIPIVASADDFEDRMAELNEAKAAAQQNLSNAQTKLEQLKEEQALAIDEKIALEERNALAQENIDLISEKIDLINEEIASVNEKIRLKELEVEEAKNNEEDQLQKYRTRIRAMEETGGYNFLSLIMNISSFSDLLSAVVDYSDIMNSDVALYEKLVDAREEHERIEAEYVEYKAQCEETKAGYESELKTLEEEKAALEKEIAEAEEYLADLAEKIKEAEEEQKRMEELEAAASYAASSFITNYYNQKKNEATQTQSYTDTGSQETTVSQDSGYTEAYETTTEPEPTVTTQQTTTYADGNGTGSYIWPFPGHYNITSPFGYRASTGSYHTGIDIDGYQSMGSPIVAADSGTVIMAQSYGGYGNCIIIDHGNGMSTLYAHLSSMYVSVGQCVSQGETIGGVGNTGTCYGIDGIHLHFEVMINGTQVDPQGYI